MKFGEDNLDSLLIHVGWGHKYKYLHIVEHLESVVAEIIESNGLKCEWLTKQTAAILGAGRSERLKQAIYVLTQLRDVRNLEKRAAHNSESHLEEFYQIAAVSLITGFDSAYLDPEWAAYEINKKKKEKRNKRRSQDRVDRFAPRNNLAKFIFDELRKDGVHFKTIKAWSAAISTSPHASEQIKKWSSTTFNRKVSEWLKECYGENWKNPPPDLRN